jgi:hypothetical protein
MTFMLRLRPALVICAIALLPACERSPNRTAYGGSPASEQSLNRTADEGSPRSALQRAGISDPTATEALNAIAHSRDTAAVYQPGGPVSDCVDGRDAGGRLVRTCNVCAVVLKAGHRNIYERQLELERSIFNVSFRRAISSSQPDVAPMDDASGVWVGATPPEVALPRSTVLFSRALTSGDVDPLGLSISDNGTVCLPPGPGVSLGMCLLPTSRPVLNVFGGSAAPQVMFNIAGRCS